MATTRSFIADVLQNRVNAAILQRLHHLNLPDAWLVAGCLFQTVWNLKTGQAPESGIRDYDIFYFDSADLSEAAEHQVSARSATLFADLGATVEVKNQARVHTWYETYFGRPYPPLQSACEGIDRFLISGTSLGIRAMDTPGDFAHPIDDKTLEQFEIYAPNGLDDIYQGLLAPNPNFDNGDLFEPKCRDYQARWPWLQIQRSRAKFKGPLHAYPMNPA